jgi:uncharacterized protein
MSDIPVSGTTNQARARFRPGVELLLVLGVSLGKSAVYSALSLIDKLTNQIPLSQQTTSINNSYAADRPWLDLSYQIANLLFPLVAVALVLYLLRLSVDDGRIGFDLRRPGFDLGRGFIMAAVIGIPGLGFYFLARQLGINTNVVPANLAQQWWTVPVLVGAAAAAAVLEEVIMLGFWFVRTNQLKWSLWVIVVSSALVRGSYHLYQGFGGFIGNVVMGLVFGLAYVKFKRVGPLVVAHFLLDLFSFVGYALLAPLVAWL